MTNLEKPRNGAYTALKSERKIRRQAETNVKKLANDLAAARLQLTKVSAENKLLREDNQRLTSANKQIRRTDVNRVEELRRRDQTIAGLRAALSGQVGA